MTLPSTVTTNHGTYERTIDSDTITCYVSGRKDVEINWLGEPRQEYGFGGMSADEIIEFLLAIKEATNE